MFRQPWIWAFAASLPWTCPRACSRRLSGGSETAEKAWSSCMATPGVCPCQMNPSRMSFPASWPPCPLCHCDLPYAKDRRTRTRGRQPRGLSPFWCSKVRSCTTCPWRSQELPWRISGGCCGQARLEKQRVAARERERGREGALSVRRPVLSQGEGSWHPAGILEQKLSRSEASPQRRGLHCCRHSFRLLETDQRRTLEVFQASCSRRGMLHASAPRASSIVPARTLPPAWRTASRLMLTGLLGGVQMEVMSNDGTTYRPWRPATCAMCTMKDCGRWSCAYEVRLQSWSEIPGLLLEMLGTLRVSNTKLANCGMPSLKFACLAAPFEESGA